MKNYLIRTGLCSEVHHKEQYIPQKELEGALTCAAGCAMNWVVVVAAVQLAAALGRSWRVHPLLLSCPAILLLF